MVRTSSVVTGQPARVRLIALKSENVYAVTTYRINGGSLSYVLASGGTGSADLTEGGWRGAFPLDAEPTFPNPHNRPTSWAGPVNHGVGSFRKEVADPPPES